MDGTASHPWQQPSGRPVTSAQRALQLLRLFIEWDSSISVTEAARKLGIGKSTVSRLLATLAAEGFVVVDPATHRYHVGPVAFELGNKFAGADLARTLQPVLEELVRQTGCTAQLGTLKGGQVLYLVVVQSSSRLRVVASPGDLQFAHASAMGKALLAQLDPAGRQEAIRSLGTSDGGPLPPIGPNTIRDAAALSAELNRIAGRGYSASNEENTAGIAAVGLAIKQPLAMPLAISISFSSHQYSPDDYPRLVEHLSRAATSIRKKFAGPESDTDDAYGGSGVHYSSLP